MAVWEISNLRYVTSQPAVFWRAFIDFRRPFEKGYFWAAVYYIDAAFGLLINFKKNHDGQFLISRELFWTSFNPCSYFSRDLLWSQTN